MAYNDGQTGRRRERRERLPVDVLGQDRPEDGLMVWRWTQERSVKPLPGQCGRRSGGQDGQVVVGRVAVQRAGAVGQQLGHHGHARDRDRTRLEQAAGQLGE